MSKDVRKKKIRQDNSGVKRSDKSNPSKDCSPKVSRRKKPEGMNLEAWQVALRKQFAADRKFKLKNIGAEPIFSEFEVTNPDTKRTYRVAIRGEGLGVNYCSCPDYAVNTLGTCKHIEFTLARLREKPGAKTAFARGFQPAYSEVFLRHGAKRDVVFHPGADCPQAVRRLAKNYFDAAGVLKPRACTDFHRFLEKASDYLNGHDLRCYDDAMEFVSRARDHAERIRRIDKTFSNGSAVGAFDRLLNVKLYPYQRAGALFAARAGRCLLADDMGLGKTIQAIAAAEILARHADVRRVLVVCPTSLKHQWKREIEKFTQRTAVVVEGGIPARKRLYEAEGFYHIVNYDVIHADLEAVDKQKYDLIVLDEAQRIKNWKTRVAQAVKKLDSDHAFVLTGTPLENRLEELHSIVEFVDRHRLGPMFRFLDAHQHVDENGRVVGYRKLDAISQTLEPILVRRTKESVLKDLPERLEKQFFVPMTEQQLAHHAENHTIVANVVRKWRRFGYLSEIDQRRLTCALQNMRMSCNSTYLLDKETDHGHKADELITLLEEILEERDAKVVIFSQWLRMHELIVRRLAKRKLEHVLFHGGVPGPKRKHLVNRFREEPDCRLFLSTDAGGVGLNLQNASAVINMDLPWNPAVLEQRIGRVHRLGQQRPVRVVNYIAENTIEQGMLGLLSFKKSMFTGVLDGGQREVFLGGTRLKKFMDSVEQATGSLNDSSTPSNGDGEKNDFNASITSADSTSLQSEPSKPSESGKPQSAASQTTTPTLQPQAISDLLTAGAAFLNQLGQSLRQTEKGKSQTTSSRPKLIERDKTTGQAYLKLPLPQGEAMQSLVSLLQTVAAGLQQKRGEET